MNCFYCFTASTFCLILFIKIEPDFNKWKQHWFSMPLMKAIEFTTPGKENY